MTNGQVVPRANSLVENVGLGEDKANTVKL